MHVPRLLNILLVFAAGFLLLLCLQFKALQAKNATAEQELGTLVRLFEQQKILHQELLRDEPKPVEQNNCKQAAVEHAALSFATGSTVSQGIYRGINPPLLPTIPQDEYTYFKLETPEVKQEVKSFDPATDESIARMCEEQATETCEEEDCDQERYEEHYDECVELMGLFLEPRYIGQLISLTAKNVSFRKIIREIGRFADVRFEFSSQADHSVTLALVDVPWDQVVDLLLWKVKHVRLLDSDESGEAYNLIVPSKDAEVVRKKLTEGARRGLVKGD